MSHKANLIWREENGVLTFEWILLITVLVIGIVGGLSAVRDATIDELGDTSEAMTHLDQSYWIDPPLQASIHDPLTYVNSENYVSGSAQAYAMDGAYTLTYMTSAYLDSVGTVYRWRYTDSSFEYPISQTDEFGNPGINHYSSVDGE